MPLRQNLFFKILAYRGASQTRLGDSNLRHPWYYCRLPRSQDRSGLPGSSLQLNPRVDCITRTIQFSQSNCLGSISGRVLCHTSRAHTRLFLGWVSGSRCRYPPLHRSRVARASWAARVPIRSRAGVLHEIRLFRF